MTNARLSFCHPIVPEKKINLKKNLLLIIRGFSAPFFPSHFFFFFLFSIRCNETPALKKFPCRRMNTCKRKKCPNYIFYKFSLFPLGSIYSYSSFFCFRVYFLLLKLVGKLSWLFACGGNCYCSSWLNITSLWVCTCFFFCSSFSV